MSGTARGSAAARSPGLAHVRQFIQETCALFKGVIDSHRKVVKEKMALLRKALPNFIIQPPNPTMYLDLEGSGSYRQITPEVMYYMHVSIIFWAPHVFWRSLLGPHGMPPCPCCCKSDSVTVHGVISQPRRIAGLHSTMLLVGWQYKCSRCKEGLGECCLCGRSVLCHGWKRRCLWILAVQEVWQRLWILWCGW